MVSRQIYYASTFITFLRAVPRVSGHLDSEKTACQKTQKYRE